MKDIFWLKMEWTNIYFYVLEILFTWIPMQGIKFRDLMSVVCTSNWNGSPASAKLKKKKELFCIRCTFASVHVGVNAGAIICYAFNRNYLIL